MKNLGLKVLLAITVATTLNAVPDPCLAKDAQSALNSHRNARSNVSGTYVLGTGDLANRLRVSQLKNGHIWFFLNAYYPYHDASGEQSANMGDAQGNIPMQGNTAVWKATDGTGTLILTFTNGKCTIKQQGADFDCGFGHNVDASGVYKKISSKAIPLKR